jgi:hypothetical protein
VPLSLGGAGLFLSATALEGFKEIIADGTLYGGIGDKSAIFLVTLGAANLGKRSVELRRELTQLVEGQDTTSVRGEAAHSASAD